MSTQKTERSSRAIQCTTLRRTKQAGFQKMKCLTICLLFGYAALLSASGHENDVVAEERLLAAATEDDFDEGEATQNEPLESFEKDLMLAEAEGQQLDLTEYAEEENARKDPKPFFKRLVRRAKKLFKKVGKKLGKVANKLEEIGKKMNKFGKGIVRHFKKKTVCYRPFGCFNNKYPWSKIWNVLPQPPRKMGTQFVLYTRKDRRGKRISIFNVKRARLSKGKPTVFIIHGWKEKYSKWMLEMKDNFLKRGDFNVFIVNWPNGASRNYFQAAGNTRLVGAQIAYFIVRLHLDLKLCFNKVHLIGFSLGAQTAGFAGRRLREKGHTIARITGLDPAGPVFARTQIKARLDSTDAKFVDVIHTSFLYFIGVKGRAGHIDFYVNGGGAQPGCGGKHAARCSHFRAVYLFMKSIIPPCVYRSYKCSRYTVFRLGFCKNARSTRLGYDVDRSARGKYYLKTGKNPPYCCK